MSFTFEALQARYGDSLFLTFKEPGRTYRMLVDAGPSTVYKTSVRPRLEKEKAAAGGDLTLDAVMVSHIDEDHIYGILDLFGELQDADQRQQERPWDVRWLLHNTFDALLAQGEGAAARALGGETVLASLGEALSSEFGKTFGHTSELVLASYAQGSKLASLAAALKITRNPPDGSPIMSVASPRVLKLGDATFTIVGPRAKELEKLRRAWKEWQDKQKQGKPATAALAEVLDTSIPNLSSIVALLEYKGTRVLLTGDARSDYVYEGLKTVPGLLDANGKLEVDVLKLPHHGSIRNIDADFLGKVKARHYVASGDGTYGNPDRGTLELIEQVRPEGGYDVHLTFPAEACDRTHEAWRRDRKGPKYDAKTDGILPVVAKWRKPASKIRVHEGPVTIPLVP